MENFVIDVFSAIDDAKIRVDEHKETGNVNVKIVVVDGLVIHDCTGPLPCKTLSPELTGGPIYLVLSEGRL